jgi:chromosome segregation ATPase
MDQNIYIKNRFKSPPLHQRSDYINSQRLNHFAKPNNNSDFYEDFIETNINNNYNNLRYLQRYNNEDINDNLYSLEKGQDYSTDVNNFFSHLNNNSQILKQENISLLKRIRTYKKELNSRDKEIVNYKQKVRALLTQIKDKNYDLDKKRNTIIKLSEEKEMLNNNIMPNHNINYENEINILNAKLQYYINEKEKNEKLIKNLKKYNQILNHNNIKQARYNNMINTKKQESEKSSEYNEENNNNNINKNINIKKNSKNENLKIDSFDVEIKSSSNKILNKESSNNSMNDIIEIQNSNFELINQKDMEINKLKNELEEKNILLKKREKIINEYALNIKKLNDENINLKENLKARIVELNEYKLKYDDDKKLDDSDRKIKFDLILRENKDLKEKFNIAKEEKINNERKIEELNEDIENLKESNENYKKQINEKNELIDKRNNELNEIKTINNNLKQTNDNIVEKINNIKNQNEQLNKENNELTQKMHIMEDNYNLSKKEINDIKAINTELKNQLKKSVSSEPKEENIINLNNIDNKKDQDETNKIKKENDILQNRVIQLNTLIEELNTQSNQLNMKYSNLKKENKNLKDVSQALIEKQKKEIEEKDKLDKISPNTHYIITKKTYNNLIWYLVSIIDPNDKSLLKKSGYESYKWVSELSIPKSQLIKYNKFEDDETKINELHSYIQKFDKFGKKEEEKYKNNININLENPNHKLSEKFQNKSSNIKIGNIFLSKLLNNNNDKSNLNNNINSNHNTLKNNANSYMNNQIGDIKNLLDELNDYKSEVSRLKNQLKDQDKLLSGVNNIKNISLDINSIVDESEDKKVVDIIKKNEENAQKDKGNFLGILNDVPGEESDLDEVKGLKKMNDYLKNDIREKEKIMKDLIEQIQEMIKQLKWTFTTNKIVTKILQILGYTPEVIKIITDNKKGFNFDFKLELKK